MRKQDLKPNMKLKINFGIPPMVAKMHVSRTGLSIICDTPGTTPKQIAIQWIGDVTLDMLEMDN